MQLKRYKPKDYRKIGMFVLIGMCIGLVTGIFLYHSFATFQTNTTIPFMNGNVVLIPKNVVKRIGIIDPVFHHDLGDVDYGLTAQENGIKVYATRIPIAMGYSNDFCRVRKWNTTLFGRFKKLYSPLGSHPKINFYFRRKHFGLINACTYIIFLCVLNILPDNVVEKIWGDLYKDK